MTRECSARQVLHADIVRLAAWHVEVREYVSPDLAASWIVRRSWFATDPHYCTHKIALRRPRAAEQDDGRCAVPGDIGALGVDDVAQVNKRKELLDDLLPELPLHEGIGRD